MLSETQKKWVGRFLKLALFVAVLIFIMLLILFNLGGNSATLKEAIEDFAHDATGYETTIKAFNHMRFYPDISFDLADVTMQSPDGKAVQVDHAVVGMGFTDVIFSTGKIRALSVEGIKAWPGTIIAPSLYVEQLAIAHNENEGTATLTTHGKIDKTPFKGALEMQPYGRDEKLKFGVAREPKFSASLDEIEANGILIQAPSVLSIKDFRLKTTQDIAHGALTISAQGITGDLTIQAPDEFVSVLRRTEDLFFPGEETWQIPPLDLTLNIAGETVELIWDGSNCDEQPDALAALLALPGFDCTAGSP